MARRLHVPRPKHATVVAYLALFVALGGSSYAAIKVTGKQVKDSSLTGRDVKNESLTSKDVRGLRLGDFATPLPAGAKGDTGPQGPKGDSGSQGDPGPAAVNLAFAHTSDAQGTPVPTRREIGHIGPWTLADVCYDAPVGPSATETTLALKVRGPTGDFQLLGVGTHNDAAAPPPDPTITTTGGGVDPNSDADLMEVFAGSSDFERLALTVQLRANGGPAATLSLNYLVDRRSFPYHCFGSGTGVLAG